MSFSLINVYLPHSSNMQKDTKSDQKNLQLSIRCISEVSLRNIVPLVGTSHI